MRCSYRHNMWCNCKKPIHHDVHVTGIGDPSVSEVTLQVSESISITFSYSPSNAPSPSSDILLGTDGDAAEVASLNYADGLATMIIDGRTAGSATVWYQLGEDASTRKTISVTVPQPEPFSPTNSIYVTKDTPGEAIQTKSKKSKKTLATAVGETYQARIFAVNSSSANYVLMEWIYGGDASIIAWVGSANNEYTTNLFNDQDVLNKIAREIEDYDNKHVLGDNIAKFSNGTWSRMENYFNNIYSPEVAQAIQGYIVEYGGTRFVTPYFNPEISDTSGNVGETVTIRGWKPDGGGLVIRDESKMVYVEGGNVGEENYNYYMTYQLLREGTSAVGFQMYDGFTGTIDVTAYPGSTPVEHISSTIDHIAIFEDDPYGSFDFNYSPTTASYPRNEIEVAYSGDISDAYMEDYAVGKGRIIVYPADVQQGSGIVTVTHTSSGETFDVSVTIGGAHVESIGEPSESSVTLNVGQTSNNISIGQSPAEVGDASRDVTLYTDNGNVAQIRWVDTTYGYICIDGINPGNTQVHYWLKSNPGTMYTIDVTVTGGPIQQISNVAQSISVENGTSTKVKLFDYLPTDANVDNVIVYNGDYYNVSDFLLENGEYNVIINGTNEGTENLKFEFEGTEYQISLTVTPFVPTAIYNLYDNSGYEGTGRYSSLVMSNTSAGDIAASCTKFNGTSSIAYTNRMFDNSTPLQEDFSWTGWVRFEEGYNSENRVIFSKGNGGWSNDSNFSLALNRNNTLQLSTGPGGVYSTQDFDDVPFTPILKKWYHIGYTLNWSTHEINLYIDGQLVETWTPNVAPGTTGTKFAIGRYHNNRRGSFIGYMNDIMFTKKELSAAEISNMYNDQISSHTNILPATISGPSENSVSLAKYEGQNVTFSYTPTDAELLTNVIVSSSNSSVATAEIGPFSDGTAAISISGIDVGNATISYYLDSDPSTVYYIDVTVTASTSPYTPTQNTIAYFPFKGGVSDFSGNEISVGNNNWSEGNKGIIFSSGSAVELNRDDIKFASVWYKASTDYDYAPTTQGILRYEHFGELSYCLFHNQASYDDKICLWEGANWTNPIIRDGMSLGEWHHLAWGEDSNGNLILAKDGVVETLITGGVGYNFGSAFKFLRGIGYDIEVSDFILDGNTWDAQDIVDYYNASKGNYLIPIQSLDGIPQSLAPVESMSYNYNIQYLPDDANFITDQVSIVSSDDNVASILSVYDGGNGALVFEYQGVSIGQTTFTYYLNGVSVGTTDVTVTPFVHVESISAPSMNSVSVMQSMDSSSINLGISPSDVSNAAADITTTSDNSSVAYIGWRNLNTGEIYVHGNNVGTTQVHYYLNSDPSTVYDIDVTVTAPEAHYDLYNNNIYPTEPWFELTANNTSGYISGSLEATEFNSGYMATNNVLGNALLGSQDFSMGTWIKLRSLPTNDWITMLCTGEPNSNYNAVIGYSQGQVYLGGWQNDRATGYALNIGEWYHLVMTHSNGTAKLYVNGNLEYETNNVNFNIQSGHFVIGSNLTTDSQFVDGYMNEVFIANKEYTAQEIADIYNASAASHVEVAPTYEFTNSIDSSETDYTLLFGDNAMNDYVNIAFTYDEQTGDVSGVNVYPTGEFNDSRYSILIDTDTWNVWEFLFEYLLPEQMATLRTYQSFDSATWSALEDLYNNPSDTTYYAASDALYAFVGGGA